MNREETKHAVAFDSEYECPYTVYQISEGPEMHYHRFNKLSEMKKMETEPDYVKVYEGAVVVSGATVFGILELIFLELNQNHPLNYQGRSLSVSDVVQINGLYFYCDSYGWEEIDIHRFPFRSLVGL